MQAHVKRCHWQAKLAFLAAFRQHAIGIPVICPNAVATLDRRRSACLYVHESKALSATMPRVRCCRDLISNRTCTTLQIRWTSCLCGVVVRPCSRSKTAATDDPCGLTVLLHLRIGTWECNVLDIDCRSLDLGDQSSVAFSDIVVKSYRHLPLHELIDDVSEKYVIDKELVEWCSFQAGSHAKEKHKAQDWLTHA